MKRNFHSGANPKIKKPARKILVVSEDHELIRFSNQWLEANQCEHQRRVDFRYTSKNVDPKQMIAMRATKIDLKNDGTIEAILSEYDLVLSFHCQQIFPRSLVENVCCINVHPGFNPYNRGWAPHAFSILNGLPAGATIHLMDHEIDHGDIIAQQTVQVDVFDTSLDVLNKTMEAEKELLRKNLHNIIEGNFEYFSPPFTGNYNSIGDYEALCKLDLTNIGSLKEHITLLRATTHAPYSGGHFYAENGDKIYVGISIDKD